MASFREAGPHTDCFKFSDKNMKFLIRNADINVGGEKAKMGEIIIKDAPLKYKKPLGYGDLEGDYNGKVGGEKEVEVAGEKYCRENSTEDCRDFLEYLEGSGYLSAQLKTRLLFGSKSYNLNKKKVDSLIRKIANIKVAENQILPILQNIMRAGVKHVKDIEALLQAVLSIPSKERKCPDSSLSNLFQVVKAMEAAGFCESDEVENFIGGLLGVRKGKSSEIIAKNLPKLLSLSEKPINLKKIIEVIKSINVLRFENADLAEIILNRVKNTKDERRLAIVVFPVADIGVVFGDRADIFDALIKNDYRVLYYEVSTDRDFYKRLKEATKDQKASLLLIGGHGTPKGVNFGSESFDYQEEVYFLDLSDKEEMNRNRIGDLVDGVLEDGGQIILCSCSTGHGEDKKLNMANLLRDVFPYAGDILAPEGVALNYLEYDSKERRFHAEFNSPAYNAIGRKLKCPSSYKRLSEKHISAFIRSLKIHSPLPGVESKAVNNLWCMGTKGREEMRKQTIKSLVGLIDGRDTVSETARVILAHIGKEAVPPLVERLQVSKSALEPLKFIARKYGLRLENLIADNWKKEYRIILPEVARALGSKGRTEFIPQLFEALREGGQVKEEAINSLNKLIHAGVLFYIRTAIGGSDIEKKRQVLTFCTLSADLKKALASSLITESKLHIYVLDVLPNKEADKEIRRLAARLLGDIGLYWSDECILEEILGVGLFTPRNDDKELCRIALESLMRIRKKRNE
ncbi:hypothetical protein AMJ44_12190 [candidate division WOR-1 bacterium DG_54_3]|uniref:Uncharacterized protein n=1 Tax=candidate division WOR-1 bacterium DG_54_3 TaxID=1703775 RepID=A0A0S7XQL0_UNCSA|nr:MAG: hypothetical protein AMJ44_12190 [candidate division WOR-1 bacterium DG_54_3]